MLVRRDIPNLLTMARILAVPVCMIIILCDAPGASLPLLWIFVVASFTDFLDGYLARKWHAVSPLGTLLDPVADKLLVALLLLYLLVGTPALFLPVVTIILRELYVSGLREFFAFRQKALPVSKGGKWKTALQMVAIILLLTEQAYGYREWLAALPLYSCGLLVLYSAALLAIISAVDYTRHCRN